MKNSVYSDQLASSEDEASWSGSTLFLKEVIEKRKFYVYSALILKVKYGNITYFSMDYLYPLHIP